MFSAALYAHVRTLLPIAHETAGAARIRHSLRPLFSRRAKNFQQSSGASYRENAKLHLPSLRGALATKQSILSATPWHGLLRCARNDSFGRPTTQHSRDAEDEIDR